MSGHEQPQREISNSKKVSPQLRLNKKDNGSQPSPNVSVRRATPKEAARFDRALGGLLGELIRQALTRRRNSDD